MATVYGTTPDQLNWLQSDLLTQTGKNRVDLDLSSQLAQMLRDRGLFEQQNRTQVSDVERQGNQLYRDLAESFAARGLQSSSPYLQADDRAFQGVQGQLGDLRSAMSSYLNTYDQASTDARLAAEQRKREIEAEALQRYAEGKIRAIGGA